MQRAKDAAARAELDRALPRTVSVSEATYDVEYDVGRKQITLNWKGGNKKRKPSLSFLPPWSGWKVRVKRASNVTVLR